jgi:hypothetical protein
MSVVTIWNLVCTISYEFAMNASKWKLSYWHQNVCNLICFWYLLEHYSIKTAEINEKSPAIVQLVGMSLFHCDPFLHIITRDSHSDTKILLNINSSNLKICGKITRRIGNIPTKNVIIYYTVPLSRSKLQKFRHRQARRYRLQRSFHSVLSVPTSAPKSNHY